MNRFVVVSSLDLRGEKDAPYDGTVVVLASAVDPAYVLFFPVSEKDAEVVSSVLSEEENVEYDQNILGIYTTMLDSWKAGDRYLSGIIIDTMYDDEAKKEVPLIRLILSDQDGMIDSFVRVNFIHAVLLAAMEDVDIIITDRLLEVMVPQAAKDMKGESMEQDQVGFPEDKNILHIAKQILEGKVNEETRKRKPKK